MTRPGSAAMLRRALCTYCLVLSLGRAGAQEPPVAGRPPQFSGAVGTFSVTMRATPTALTAEDPLILTVRIEGAGNLPELRRPDLRRIPKFDKSFAIVALTERAETNPPAREFTYQLRPR